MRLLKLPLSEKSLRQTQRYKEKEQEKRNEAEFFKIFKSGTTLSSDTITREESIEGFM